MARSTRRVQPVYGPIDQARAKLHEAMGQVEAEPPEARPDVPNPATEDEARGRMYGMATPSEVRTGRRFPAATKFADPAGTGRVAGRDYMEVDRQRGAALTDSEVRA